MSRKKILWLVSWYPNKYDRFNGDFIQRHAQAASIDNDIFVIYLQDATDIACTEEEINFNVGLTEQRIYYKKCNGLFGSFRKQIRFFSIYMNAIKVYIQKYGFPHCIHVHVPWKAGLLALWMKRVYGIPYLVSEHWSIYNSSLPDSFKSRPFYFKKLLKEIFRNADDLIVVSEKLGKDINCEVLSMQYQIVPNVVDTRIFKPSESKNPIFTFLHVSNMVPLKNVDTILTSFKQFLDASEMKAQLILIGNRNESYVKMAVQLGLLNTNIFFPGEISYLEVAHVMQSSHCLILNSSYETFSCVVAEALCCGLPVIGTKVGVIPDIITRVNGIEIVGHAELPAAMIQVFNNYSFYDSNIISKESADKFNYAVVSIKFDKVYNRLKCNID